MRLVNWLLQVVVVTRLNLLTLWERRGASFSAIVGIAGVVAVLVGTLAVNKGFQRAMGGAGREDTAIVLRQGSDSEMMSVLSREQVRLVADGPGVVRTDEGPASSGELYVIINLPRRDTGTDANVAFRGVEPGAFAVRPQFELVAGRLFEWGRNELIVGQGATTQFEGVGLGEELELGRNTWQVVGIFTAEGGLSESELWTDVAVLQPAYQRGSTYQAVHARLESPESFQGFKDALTSDPRLGVKVQRETEFYAEQSFWVTALVTTLGALITVLMAFGAIVGALNTMYSAVSSRSREIATLRALGFRGGPVVLSVLVESVLLAILGGLLGGGISWLLLNGFRTATMNWQSFSQVTFSLEVTPELLVRGVFYATLIGLFGGLLPALRALRMSLATALREQ